MAEYGRFKEEIFESLCIVHIHYSNTTWRSHNNVVILETIFLDFRHAKNFELRQLNEIKIKFPWKAKEEKHKNFLCKERSGWEQWQGV